MEGGPTFGEVFAAELKDVGARLAEQARRADDGERAAFKAKRDGIIAIAASGGSDESVPSRPSRASAYDLEQARVSRRRGTDVEATPHTGLGLVGLAFSGGGIRSATFNFGVLQVLAREGILKHVDYLSTVSGGGYIGSCLSGLLTDPRLGTDEKSFPFRHTPGQAEPRPMKQLRAAGDFLAPGGVVDYLKMPAIIVRGAMLNFLCLVPWLLILAVITQWVLGWNFPDLCMESKSAPFDVTPTCGPGGVKLYWRDYMVLGAPAVAVWTVVVLLWAVVRQAGSLSIWGKRPLAENWEVRNGVERVFAVTLALAGAMLVVGLVPGAIIAYHRFRAEFAWHGFQSLFTAFGALLTTGFAGKAASALNRKGGLLGMLFFGVLGPLVVLLVYLELTVRLVFPYEQGLAFTSTRYLVVAALLFAFAALFVNPNVTAVHNWYRDRLSKAFLFKLGPDLDVAPGSGNDALRLSELCPPGTVAPYHLVNCAVNLQGTRQGDRLGRQTDFFVLAKRFVGGERCGYCATEVMQSADQHINLGTAMAISAAAATPNAGTSTVRPLVFVLALLNVRLGYWIRNPRRLGRERLVQYVPSPGPGRFLAELFGLLSPDGWFVNVSDGGHIENLAIFELLRRHCKFIIAGDGECDPRLRCGGLATVIRYARSDLGIDIHIDLRPLQDQKDDLEPVHSKADALPEAPEHVRFSQRHWAVGTIDYGNGEIGRLLYIKSSLTGDENPYVEEYHATHPSFPHESTGDQFFDEKQFEAYRALGSHAANDLFPEEMKLRPEPDLVSAWFNYLDKEPQAARTRE